MNSNLPQIRQGDVFIAPATLPASGLKAKNLDGD